MICKVRPYEGDEPYIFFSYCHADADKVYPIIEKMTCSGYRIWYDEGIHPGADWPEVIAQKLEKSKICIVAVSTASAKSHNCRNEMTFAVENQKYLISLQLENFSLPLGIRLQLAATQMIKVYAYSEDKFYEKLYTCKQLHDCFDETRVTNPAELEEKFKITEEAENFQLEIEVENLFEKRLHEKHRLVEETEHLRLEAEETEKHRLAEEAERLRLEAEAKEKQENEDTDDETVMNDEDDEETVMDDSDDDDTGDTFLEDADTFPVLVRLNSHELFLGNYPLTSIGRSRSECDIYFESARTMTSHHADIVIHDGHYFLIDHNSANGTYINGKKMDKNGREEIQNYAEISLSKSEPFVVAFDKYADWIKENMCLISMTSLETREKMYLFEDEVVLGRSFPWASGAMTNDRIGRKHAMLRITDGKCYIIDQSKNGTYVNDEKIEPQKPQILHDGDRLRFGKEHFIFNYYTLTKGEML